NVRDHATLEQLVVLTNLESINGVLIRQSLPQSERLQKLNEIAISQMKSLLNSAGMKKLK
ncbi:MAG: KilA-N domain-containing protein, partial [Chitinophagaceae bacterium]|nr:KilA-N domain-containing protein [Chitinophagaceae bacterium]